MSLLDCNSGHLLNYHQDGKQSAYNLPNSFMTITPFKNDINPFKNDINPTPELKVNYKPNSNFTFLQNNINNSLNVIMETMTQPEFKMSTIDKLSSLDVAPNTEEIPLNFILDVALNTEEEIVNDDVCNECNIKYKIIESSMICENCGIEKNLNAEYNSEIYNSSVEGNYNGGTTASLPFMFSGPKSYGYQKALLKSCSDYTNASYQTIKKEILNRINMYNGNKPPMNVQLECVDIYYKIKENDKLYLNIINKGMLKGNEKKRLVFRSNGKWGLIGECLHSACLKFNLTRTSREIAEIIGIEEKYLSVGSKRLQEFHELGIVDIPMSVCPMDDYIRRYFLLLGIPAKYQSFVVDIINRADKKYLHINNESRMSIKCIGSIYMLCSRVPELHYISKEAIARECKISKTTFMKYYGTLYAGGKILKKTFRKHKIPMPVEWKDDRKK